jgi:hypothetical protein
MADKNVKIIAFGFHGEFSPLVIASPLPPIILSSSPPVILTLSVAKGKDLTQGKLREGSQKQDRFFALRAQNDMILQDYADVILSEAKGKDLTQGKLREGSQKQDRFFVVSLLRMTERRGSE